MVLLPEIDSFSYAAFINQAKSISRIEKESGDNIAGVFNIDDEEVYLMVKPVPIPQEDMENTAKYMYNWPTAAEDVQDHKSHIILALTQDGGNDSIKRFRLLTKLICALLNVTKAMGVYFGEQSLLISKEAYLEEAKTMSDSHLPINLWVYLGLRTIEGKTNGYTYGLKAFDKDEVEIVGSEKSWTEVRELLFNICHYVLMNDVIFKAGQTFGYTEKQKIPISYSKGRFVNGNSFKLAY
jgi:hypothetical protein